MDADSGADPGTVAEPGADESEPGTVGAPLIPFTGTGGSSLRLNPPTKKPNRQMIRSPNKILSLRIL